MTEKSKDKPWPRTPAALEAMATILRDPSGDHTELMARLLDGRLTKGRAAAVVQLIDGAKTLDAFFPGCFTKNKAIAQWLVLYHLAGGGALGFSSPAMLAGDKLAESSKTVAKRLAAMVKAHTAEKDRLQKARLRASDGEQARLQLEQLASELFDAKLLRTETAAGGGGEEPPRAPALTAWDDGDRLLAFAMGTHEKLGGGTDGKLCAVRLLAGHHDVLRAIANHLKHGHMGGAIRPAPHELFEMRKINFGLERERLMLRAAIDELRDELHSQGRALARSLRREAALKKQLETTEADWDAAVEQLVDEYTAEQRRWQQLLKASEKGRSDEAVRWQLKVNAANNAGITAVRAKVAEQREQLRRAAADCEAALAEQLAAEQRAGELEAALERVRSCTKAKLLEEIAEQRAKIAKLSERRKVNQRKIGDANLADRRAAEAQKRLEAERASMRTFMQREEINNEHVDAARAEAQELRTRLAAAEAEAKAKADLAEKYKSVAEPAKEYFFDGGRFTAAVDQAILECLMLGVARNKVPQLFDTFRRFFRVEVPSRLKKVQGKRVDGKRTAVERLLLYLPGLSHCKDVAALMYMLNKLQVGEWIKAYLESDDETSMCYIQDGAESQQVDYLGQILARRINGELQLCALDLAALKGKTAEAQAAAFHTSIDEIIELMKAAEMADERTVNLLRRFVPTCSMNDRASTARKTARLVLGLDDGDDDPTCAEHGLVNILEAGRKAMDKVLRRLLSITDEQAASDEAKIKALRTCVGWFSSPACALIYQVAKYVALCSSKGYAIGEKFREWLDTRLADAEDQTLEMLGHSEDLLAICGSRMYVFFQDAAVTERLLSAGSLLTYLEEEADLGADAGGKLRKSILTGAKNEPCMAAVRAMAIISDTVFWQILHAIKPGPETHTFDVLPKLWPQVLEFMAAAAADPSKILDRSLRLDTSAVCGARAVSHTPKAQRARADMERIFERAAGNELVMELLSEAFGAMAAATKNHASDWLGPDGKLCAEKITPELRAKYDAHVATSTCAERLHAFGRHTDDRAGQQRWESHGGIALAMFNKQAAWLQTKTPEERQRLMDAARPAARKLRRITLKEQRIVEGRAKRAERDRLLSSKREKRQAKAAEKARIEQLPLATKYSELKTLGNAELSDQLKAYKMMHQKTGFTTTQASRKAYILQVQRLMYEVFGPSAADLKEGDSGIDGRGLRKKRVAKEAGTAKKGGKRRRSKIVEYNGYEWDEDEEFEVDCIIGKMIADGGPIPGPPNAFPPPAGTVLYKVLWQGFPPEVATWEPEQNLQMPMVLEEIDKYEAELAAEAVLDAESNQDLADDDAMDESQ